MKFQGDRKESNMPAVKEKNTVSEIEKVLAQEIEFFQQYLAALKLDNDLMSKLQINELEQNNKVKNTILLKLKAMDQARQNLVKQFAASNQIPETEVRILDICARATAEEAQRITALKDELQRITAEIHEVQGKTAALAQASLNWVNSSISTLKKMLTPAATYNLQGKVGNDEVFAGRVVEKQV